MAPTTRSVLILDFGGVLTTDLWESIRVCARQEGLPDDALLTLMREDPLVHSKFTQLEQGEISQDDFEEVLARAAGTSPDKLLQRMCADLRPDWDMLHAVEAIRESNVRIGILSNSWGSGYFSPYDGYDLEDRADAIIYSDRVKLRKPDPAIFDLALKELDAAASDAVFVDDLASNLVPAEAMGMHTIHHVQTATTIQQLDRAFRQR